MNDQEARHWIAGAWVKQGEIRQTVDVTTGAPGRQYYFGVAAQADLAIAVAREQFDRSPWAHSPRIRSQVLFELAEAINSRSADIAGLITIESGKVLGHALGEVRAAVSECRYYAGLARAIFGRVSEIDAGMQSIFTREAIGVAAIIVPWNAPATLLVRALAPALAAGCTIVLKGAHQTAGVTDIFAQCLAACPSLPEGVVNVVHGDLEVSKTLVAHGDVDVISFTGSSATGKAIMAAAAPTMKRLSLELGGKSPALVFADADLDLAAREISAGIIPICGQMCTAIGRVLIEDAAWDAFMPRLTEALKGVVVGNPADGGTQMGPLLDSQSGDRYEANTVEAASAGETVLAGTRLENWPRRNFVTPALYRIEDRSHRLVREELFAPIGILETFRGEEDVVISANATRYGLAASVFTQDEPRSKRIARALKSGTVWINCHNRLFAEAETGGYRQSGLGRLHGLEGLADFLETKHIYSEFGHLPTGPKA